MTGGKLHDIFSETEKTLQYFLRRTLRHKKKKDGWKNERNTSQTIINWLSQAKDNKNKGGIFFATGQLDKELIWRWKSINNDTHDLMENQKFATGQ